MGERLVDLFPVCLVFLKGELRPKTDPPFSVHEHIEAFLVSKNIPLCLNRFPLPEPGGGQNWLSLCFHLKLSSHPVQKR